MAEFVKVTKEKERMCKQFINCGAGCPINELIDEGLTCWNWMSRHPEEAERVIMQWAAEHPEPDPAFEKLKAILESSDKDDDLLCKIVKWFVEYYKNPGNMTLKEEESNG